MKSKFNIGDEIYFMKYSEPAKQTVKGIAFVIGEFEDSSTFKKKGDYLKPSITYYMGSYTTIDENSAYATKDELQKALFSKL